MQLFPLHPLHISGDLEEHAITVKVTRRRILYVLA
jgi:hypothetical protein